MGRFASTASLYEQRPPYPREFFRTVTHKLGLTKESSLIDLGTGPACWRSASALVSAVSSVSTRSLRCLTPPGSPLPARDDISR